MTGADDTAPAEALALIRIADIVPCTLDDAQRERLTDVVAQVAARAAAAERERALAVLAEHYLMDVICVGDQDNPVCGCSRIFLGWHPSIGAARQAWIDHVADLLAAQDTPPTTTEETR